MLPTSFTRRRAMMLSALAILGACTADKLVGPSLLPSAPLGSAVAPSGGVVISQVYSGGGLTNAAYQNDYVELYNAGSTTVNLGSWSLQYASAAGTGNFGSSASQLVVLNGSIAPGQYYLIRLKSAAAIGDTLPTAQASNTTLDMSGSAGKVALVNQATSLGCNGGSAVCTTDQLAHIMDLVGYGATANFYEGTARAPAPTVALAIFRKDGGRQDTDVNGSDFETAPAAPRNTSSPLLPPSGGTASTPHTVTSVTVSPATPTVVVGGSQPFSASALDSVNVAVSGTSFTWSSSNTAVATVTSSGAASALAAGTTTITARTANGTVGTATLTVTAPAPIRQADSLVISQVYGGGGNSGATLRYDYIELYNGGPNPVALDGWTVQFASPGQSTWSKTALTGTVAPGHYFLIQESAGANALAADLPIPADLVATTDVIAVGSTGGKVALVKGTTALTGACPKSDAGVVDFVGYGQSGTPAVVADCFEGAAAGPVLTNTTATYRKDGGRQDTNDNAADFTSAAPVPRNSNSPVNPPKDVLLATITPASVAVQQGTPATFTVTASKNGTPVAITSTTWTSSNTTVATISASGAATTLAIGTTTISAAIVTAQGATTGTATLAVSGAPASVVITPAEPSVQLTQTLALTASALDANNQPVGTTFTWASSNPDVATISAAGVVTPVTLGTTTITATSANNIAGTATLTVTPRMGSISVQPRTNGLPKGFQTQVFLNNGSNVDASGATVTNSDVTWSSANPAIVSVDPNTGVITGNTVGTANVIATVKSDGVTKGSTPVTVTDPAVSSTARTGHNTELGTPTDADPSDDVIITRRQYTLSYNDARHTPNWVSWNLDASHKGSAVRCNCMTADTALTRLGLRALDTQDWVNGGTWSRGHMSPSADWNVNDGDNAPTFFLTNMIPQNQTANAGAWGNFEDYLRTQAVGGTEIYIVAGPIYTRGRTAGNDGFGFTSGTGHIAVPDSMWKVAVIVPDGRSADGITAPTDVRVVAVNMENSAVSTGSWDQAQYQTTIAKIERSTGYNLLSTLPENIQCKLEVRNCVPAAAITGAGLTGGNEGQTLAFSAATSSDADNDALSFSWTLNGTPVGTGAALSHVFATPGSYTLSLTATDGKGGTSTTSATVAIANVTATVSPIAGAALNDGETYAATGTFTDPGIGPWTATVDYGDGAGAQPLALSDRSFSLSHVYLLAGSHTVTVTVNEAGAPPATSAATVTVTNVPPVVSTLAGASIAEGSGYAASGSFADPGVGPWTATVDYGDGSGTQPLALAGKGFSLSHTYANDGAYTVTVTVSEAGVPSGSGGATVTVADVAPAVAAFTGATIAEAGSYAASGSFADPGSDSWTATVNYGDGSGTQPLALAADKTFSLSHVYADNGSYTVTVTVTETSGGTLAGSASATVTVTNVAPQVAAFSGASILRNESYTSSGTFTDVGTLDTHTATVNYGDGTGASALAVSGGSFALGHTYTTAGTFTVTVIVTDKDGGVGTRTAVVVVQSAQQGTPALASLVGTLGTTLNAGEVSSLQAKVTALGASLRRENDTPARNQLDALVNEVNAMVTSGRLTAAQASPVLEYATRLRASI